MKIAFEKIHKPEICDELVSTSNTTYKPTIEDVIDNTNEELENLEKKKIMKIYLHPMFKISQL